MKYQNLGDSVYFWFAANDTSGSGNDGATPVFDVRLAGDTSSAAPVYSGSATLLSHANYPPGAHEIAVPATTGNGFVAGNEYAVFCTLLVDSQNPTGFVGDFKLDAVYADIIEVGGDSQSMIDFKDFVDYGYLPDQHKVYDVYNTDELLAAVLTGCGDVQSRIPTALVDGRMDSDLQAIQTDQQSVTDLKDFTDYGYIPTEHKVYGSHVTDDLVTATLTGTGDIQSTVSTILEAVNNLAVGSGGIATTAGSFTKAGAEPETNTYTATVEEDGTYHIVEDDTGTTDGYYEFDVGNDGVPQSIEWMGYAQSNGDSYAVYLYNWGGTAWEQVGTIDGANGTTPTSKSLSATIAHVGSGSNVGKVRFRFYSTDGTAFATDRILCVYTQISQGITNGSTITLSASTTNQNFIGHNWNLALGGQDIGGSYFFQAISVTGIGTCSNGSPYTFQECNFPSTTLSAYGYIENSAISDLTFTSTAGVSADTMNVFHCQSGVAGAGAPTFDFSGVTKTTNVQIRKWSGGGTWTFTSDCVASIEVIEGGTHTITTGGGNVELRGIIKSGVITSSGSSVTNIHGVIGNVTVNGTGGTVNLYGVHGTITDNSSGNVTINDYGIDLDDITNTTSNVSTILSRVIGTIAAGTHNAQSGDAYARIGATGSSLTSLASAANLTLVKTVTDILATMYEDATGYRWTEKALEQAPSSTGGDATAANQVSILANQTTILSRLLGTIAAGTHIAQSGDGYAILNDGTIGNSALKTILNSIAAEVGGDTTITNKNVRICEVVYDSDTYHFAVGVNSLDEINDIVEDWALENFGILSGGETVLSPALDLPSALVYTKTLSDVITTISDIEDDIYEIST